MEKGQKEQLIKELIAASQEETELGHLFYELARTALMTFRCEPQNILRRR